jgi:hypothetical protein
MFTIFPIVIVGKFSVRPGTQEVPPGGAWTRYLAPSASAGVAATAGALSAGVRWHADIEALRVIHPGLRTLTDWLAESGAAAIRARHTAS